MNDWGSDWGNLCAKTAFLYNDLVPVTRVSNPVSVTAYPKPNSPNSYSNPLSVLQINAPHSDFPGPDLEENFLVEPDRGVFKIILPLVINSGT